MNHSGRLALLVPSLRGGGAERVMVLLANGYADRGYSVDLLLTRADGAYLAEVPSDVTVVDLAAGRVVVSLAGPVRYLRRERSELLEPDKPKHFQNVLCVPNVRVNSL